jgi:CDP-glycerol glycerophosphotransferase
MVKKIARKVKRIMRRKVNTYGPNLVNKYTQNKPLIDNLIVFESFFGRQISDNPKAIYDALDSKKFLKVFLVNRPQDYRGYNVARRKGLRNLYYLNRAKIIISNQRLPEYWTKKEGQTVIQTWHGTPLKKLVHDLTTFDMPSAESLEQYLTMFDKDVERWDYLLSSCHYTTEKMRSAFNYKGTILEIGFPRNDKLYKAKPTDITKIKKRLHIPADKKVILYAPTYRDDQNEGVGNYYFDSELDFAMIKKAFPDVIILIRYHYIINKSNDFENDDVINVSDYPDINDLYLITDILVTDYSSVFFDYSILRKPFLFFTPDIKKYEKNLRGFYLDFNTAFPTKPVLTTSELIEQIKNIKDYDFDTFSEKYNPIRNKNWEKGILKVINEHIRTP